PAACRDLIEAGMLSSEIDPVDPMEKAIVEIGDRLLPGQRELQVDARLVKEYPLRPQLLAHTHAWSSLTDSSYVVATKGAPEAVAGLCRLSDEQREILNQQTARMANDGLRV